MLAMNIRSINAIQHRLPAIIGMLSAALALHGGSWPRFLGPNQDGSLPDQALPSQWGDQGPKKLWQKAIGSGFAGPIALDDRVIIFHREGDNETLLSLDPVTGDEQWRFRYPSTYRDDFGFDNGPRSTPTADRGQLYSYGAEGRLHCLEVQTGKPIWNVDTQHEFGAPKGFFGIACSPLVIGDAVLVNIGSSRNAGIVAFNRLTGTTLWTASRDEASYSSPVAATLKGIESAVFFDRAGLKVVHPKTGNISATYPWRPRINASVNAASPLVFNEQVFLTTSYNTGAVVLDLAGGQARKVWSSDEALSCHYGTPVRLHDKLFGFHGRQERGAQLHCVDWSTGKVLWRTSKVRIGTITLVGQKLLILQETGELTLAQASAQAYQELDRAQILPSGVRAFPAIAGGILYARSPSRLVAYQVIP